MKSKYFLDIDEALNFISYLEFMGINYLTLSHKQVCSKFDVVYYVYEVKYSGDE